MIAKPTGWKALSLKFATFGVALPEIIQQLADYAGLFALLPAEWRLGAYAVVGAALLLAKLVTPQGRPDS